MDRYLRSVGLVCDPKERCFRLSQVCAQRAAIAGCPLRRLPVILRHYVIAWMLS